MTEEQKEILKEAASIAADYAREQSDERIARRREEIEENGSEILELDAAVQEAIREKAAPFYPSFQTDIDPALYALYTREVQ